MPKISELTAGSTPTGIEVLPVVQNGRTVKLTLSQVALGGVYDISRYGATTTATDNGPAINAAIVAANAAGGGIVYVPSGDFRFSTTIDFQYDNITLAGCGVNSKLSYTGTGAGLNLSGGLDNINVRDLQLYSASTTNKLCETRAVFSTSVFSGVYFNGGGYNISITSSGASLGSYDMHFIGCTFGYAALISVWIHPGAVGYAQALYFDHCQWFGFAQALFITSGSGIFVTNCHIERHTGNTTPPIHIDTSNKVVIDNNYFEDSSNCAFIELGSSLHGVVISNNYIVVGVDGGSVLSATCINCTQPVTELVLIGNHFGGGGTVTNGVNLSSSTVYARGNTIALSCSYGWASTGTSAGVNIDSTDYTLGTFSTAQQQVGVGRMANDLSNYASGVTGTGAIVLKNNALLVTPDLGDATGHSIRMSDNGVAGHGIALGATSIATNSHGTINFDTGGAIYTNSVAAITFTTGNVTLAGVTNVAAGSAVAPSLAVGGGTTGLYSVSTSGFGFSVAGSLKMDWGISTAGQWTLSGNTVSIANTIAFGATAPGALATGGAINFSGGSGVPGLYVNAIPAITFPTVSSANVVLNGSALANNSGGIGYTAGAGGTVTQATSKSTGVALNKASGAITLNNASLAAGTIVSFALTNTAIAATDVLILNHISGGTVGSYLLNASCASGSATIYVRNETGGALAEAIVISFVLIKAATS